MTRILGRFRQLPVTLYRVQRMPVALRSYDAQMAKGRTSFDLKERDGLVHPAVGDDFIGPNGMSLRPRSAKMVGILRDFQGDPRIFALHEGLTLPDDLVVLHEHSDHYSLQTAVPIALVDLNRKLTEFLSTLPSQSKEQFLEAFNDPDDQDN